MCFLGYDGPPNPRGFSRSTATTFDHHHQHQPSMDIEPKEKLNISDKLETIDYSHGVSAAINTSRGWGTDRGEGGSGDQPTVQSVDYNHGQGAGLGGYAGSGFPPADQGGYGEFPSYNYEGFPPASVQPGGFFPQGIDPATLFAAYNEQTGESQIVVVRNLCQLYRHYLMSKLGTSLGLNFIPLQGQTPNAKPSQSG